MHCNYRDGERCRLASEVLGLPVVTSAEACQHCSQLPNAQQLNEVTASLSLTAVAMHQLDVRPFLYLQDYVKRTSHSRYANAPLQGPGTILKTMIAWF